MSIRTKMNLIKRIRNLGADDHHSVLNYYGRSSRKQADIRKIECFGPIAKEVIESGKTYLYYDRLYTFYNILLNIKRGYGEEEKLYLAESGVYKGGGSFFIASILSQLGVSNFQLYSIDTFEGHSKLDLKGDTGDGLQKAGDFNETSFESVQNYLSVHANISVRKGRIQDVANSISDKKYCFVHLDMDIYQPTLFSLDFFDDKLLPGAVIVLDDYGFTSCPGVKKAVDEFLLSHPNYNVVPLLSGQCLLIKY